MVNLSKRHILSIFSIHLDNISPLNVIDGPQSAEGEKNMINPSDINNKKYKGLFDISRFKFPIFIIVLILDYVEWVDLKV